MKKADINIKHPKNIKDLIIFINRMTNLLIIQLIIYSIF